MVGAVRVLATVALLVTAAAAMGWWIMIQMPGKSHRGPLPALTETQADLRDALREDVEMLAGTIGERNVFRYDKLVEAAQYIERSLAQAGYEVHHQEFKVGGQTCVNLSVEIKGRESPDEIVVVGGHYDSVMGCPGANDNGTGAAATLVLARAMRALEPARTVRFVLFVNEEPPFFQTSDMGSWVYAKACRQRDDNVVAMISLETIGYYRDEKGSQRYPVAGLGLVYPSAGNFISFVGNVGSRRLVRRVVKSFRRHAAFPSQGGALPGAVPGVGWSDHWSFWQEGYPALMVTDTAPYRYPHYHEPTDTPDKIDYERTARVVAGLQAVVEELAN